MLEKVSCTLSCPINRKYDTAPAPYSKRTDHIERSKNMKEFDQKIHSSHLQMLILLFLFSSKAHRVQLSFPALCFPKLFFFKDLFTDFRKTAERRRGRERILSNFLPTMEPNVGLNPVTLRS